MRTKLVFVLSRVDIYLDVLDGSSALPTHLIFVQFVSEWKWLTNEL